VSHSRVALLVLFIGIAQGKSFPTKHKLSLDKEIPSNFEASGAAWNPTTNMIATVSDEGKFSIVALDGSAQQCYTFGQPVDLESATFGPESSHTHFVYLGHEWPAQILEVNLATWVVTRVFNTPVHGDAKRGMESLTFIPDAGSSTRGRFVCGDYTSVTQYAFDFNTATSGETLPVVASRQELISGKKDISGLSWDSTRGILWALYDTGADLYSLAPQQDDWVKVHHYGSVPGTNQEGVAIAGASGEYIVVANDVNKHSDKHKQLDRYDWDASDGARSIHPSSSSSSSRSVKKSTCISITLPAEVPLTAVNDDSHPSSHGYLNPSSIIVVVAACTVALAGVTAFVVHRWRRNRMFTELEDLYSP